MNIDNTKKLLTEMGKNVGDVLVFGLQIKSLEKQELLGVIVKLMDDLQRERKAKEDILRML